MPLALTHIPGFADLPDASLVHDTPAAANYLAKISENAGFAMLRPEVFAGTCNNGPCINGGTIDLPVSPVDGYTYQRKELLYVWGIQSSLNPQTGWLTGPDSLWYAAWKVQQWSDVDGADNSKAGLVSTDEWYRRSGDHANPQQSPDGTLQVSVIGLRQRTLLMLADLADTFADIADSAFATDKPLTESLLQNLNDNAKFAVLQAEVIYMGEFVDGDTIGRPTSPADGYEYTYAETIFMPSWRWTTDGSAYTQPDFSLGQLDRISVAIDASTGDVAIDVQYKGDSAPASAPGHGRVAVFAFCSRANLIPSILATANAFAEIALGVFRPGADLRASTLLQLSKNIREAACCTEFFGPTNKTNGDTVAAPTSSLDGYTYSRDELNYIWDWAHTTPQTTGQHYRLPAFEASIASTGAVSLTVWRLPPGGPYVTEPSGDSDDAIRVLVMARRKSQHSALTAASSNPPSDSGSITVDNNPPDTAPYAIPWWRGDSYSPTAGERILLHQVPGDVASMTLPASLTGSKAGCITAPTGSIQFTLKKSSTLTGTQTTLGTINIASAANSATFTFSAAVTLNPGDFLHVYAPASQDATLAGFFMTLSGTRT